MNYNEIMAERKAKHEAVLAEIDKQLHELGEKRRQENALFKEGNKAITEAAHEYAIVSPEAIAKRQLKAAHNLHRVFTAILQDKTRQDKTRQDKTRQDKTRLNQAESHIRFDMQPENVVFTITIPRQ